MIKWLWYINILFVLVSVLILSLGIAGLPQNGGVGGPGFGRDNRNNPNASDEDSDAALNLSPLVAAIEDFSERWEPPRGRVKIKIEPGEVLEENPRWRVGNGPWHTSGELSSRISAGTHLVNFAGTAHWNPPKPIEVSVARKQITSETVTYSKKPPPQFGNVQVTIDPCQVLDLGAQWRIGTQTWKNSGEIEENILVGKRMITFKPVPGWNPPPTTAVEIARDQTAAVSVSYQKIPPPPPPVYGSLTVTIEPEKAVQAGAQWRIKGKDWQINGATLKLEVGTYPVEFKPLGKLWTTPKSANLLVKKDETLSHTGTYSQIKPPGPKNWIIKGTFSSGGEWGCVFLQTPKLKKDTCFFIGDEIEDGFTLSRVSEGAIVVSKNGYDYDLEMPKKAPAAPARPAANPPPTSSRSRYTRPPTPARR